MNYEFMTAARVVFGAGRSAELPQLAAEFGRRPLLVCRRNLAANSPAGELAQQLVAAGARSFAVSGEPDITIVEKGARLACEHGCDLVIGLGGGSALDTAKAIAALAPNSGRALDYLEVVGAGRALEHPALAVVAVPTTAGTGSEVTRNAVISEPQAGVKASMRHHSMLPRLALVDPRLTHDLPPSVTASCGMDALTQLLEPYVSRRAQPLTDGLCLEGMALAVKALPRAYFHPDDAAAREAMSSATLMSGMALANAGLGAVHGIAAPFGGAYRAPHGAICAALLPHVTAVNIAALRRSDPQHPALARYARAAEVILGRPDVDALPMVLGELVVALGIPRLAIYGLTVAGIPPLAAAAAHASSTRANPIDLEPAEMEQAILAAL